MDQYIEFTCVNNSFSYHLEHMLLNNSHLQSVRHSLNSPIIFSKRLCVFFGWIGQDWTVLADWEGWEVPRSCGFSDLTGEPMWGDTVLKPRQGSIQGHLLWTTQTEEHRACVHMADQALDKGWQLELLSPQSTTVFLSLLLAECAAGDGIVFFSRILLWVFETLWFFILSCWFFFSQQLISHNSSLILVLFSTTLSHMALTTHH